MNLAFFGWGHTEVLLVLLAILLLFGARRLPELARALGKSLSEFRKGRAEGETRGRKAKDEEEEPPDSGDEPPS